MHHANLPIEIIIKRYLWPGESPRRVESGYTLGPLGTPASPSTPTYRNLAASAPFAPSAYNIRCAKIGKSTEREEDGKEERKNEKERRDE